MQVNLYSNQIWLFKEAVDFRLSIDGLSSMVENHFKLNAQKGIFVFYNRKKDRIKCLSWHKNGFVILYKRLERGRFFCFFEKPSGKIGLSKNTFEWLIAGLDWQKMDQWKELSYEKFS